MYIVVDIAALSANLCSEHAIGVQLLDRTILCYVALPLGRISVVLRHEYCVELSQI